MLKLIRILLLSSILVYSAGTAVAQDIEPYRSEQLMQRLNTGKDTLYVVNFWATWCAPCVRELPEFDKIAQRYKGKPVKIILVSLDFKESYPEKMQKFIKQKKLEHEVVWLSETNANEFIPKIANEWQGSIPATMLYYKKKSYRNFFEGVIKAEQVNILIDKQLSSRY